MVDLTLELRGKKSQPGGWRRLFSLGNYLENSRQIVAVPTALRGGRCHPCFRAATVLRCCYSMQSGGRLPADCDELQFLLPELAIFRIEPLSLQILPRPVATLAALPLTLVVAPFRFPTRLAALRRLSLRLRLMNLLGLRLMNLLRRRGWALLWRLELLRLRLLLWLLLGPELLRLLHLLLRLRLERRPLLTLFTLIVTLARRPAAIVVVVVAIEAVAVRVDLVAVRVDLYRWRRHTPRLRLRSRVPCMVARPQFDRHIVRIDRLRRRVRRAELSGRERGGGLRTPLPGLRLRLRLRLRRRGDHPSRLRLTVVALEPVTAPVAVRTAVAIAIGPAATVAVAPARA